MAVGGDRGIDGSDRRGVIGLVVTAGIQPVAVATDNEGVDALANTGDAICGHSGGTIFQGFSVGGAEEKRVERGVGVGGARNAVLAGAHLLDRTISGDVLGNRAVRGACFWIVSMAFAFYRCEYDRARACERGIENGRVLSVLKRASSLPMN